MFLKPPLGGVYVFVWTLQRRSKILWGESLEQPCCLPASPLLLWQPLALPALGSHRAHSALSKHLPVCSGSESSQSLWMCTCCSLCNGSREVAWRIPFVCSKRTRNVCGWLKTAHRIGISVCRSLTMCYCSYLHSRNVTLRKLDRMWTFGMKNHHLMRPLSCTVPKLTIATWNPLTVPGLVFQNLTSVSKTAVSFFDFM